VIGAECRECHEASHDRNVESFALNINGKSGKFLNDSRAARCESCHGNPEKHMGSGKPEDIINPAKLPSAQGNEWCLKCHVVDRHLNNWKGAPHDRKDVSCLSCHSVHHAMSPERMLKSVTVEEGCFSCHNNIKKALFQRSTHLFRTENWDGTNSSRAEGVHPEGLKMNCVTCHNPHGGEGRKMLVARSLNDTCYQCHAEKRGPFLWEHAPVTENCMTCHTPHGSNNASLLVTRSHQLCQQCHVNILARHQTVAGFDVFTFNRGCVNCHTQIHGSNSPAGKAFVR